MKLATLCYVQDRGKVLMLHRNKRPNDYHYLKWNGLGGKLQQGETPEEGARREIIEESGLSVAQLEWKGVITFPLFDGEDDWYVFLFQASNPSGELIESAEGELHWIKKEKLLELNLWPGDKVFLPWLDTDRFFSAKFNYVEGEFRDYSVEFYPGAERK